MKQEDQDSEIVLGAVPVPASLSQPSRSDAPVIAAVVCGTKLCRDGQPHDDDALVEFRDERGRVTGGSVACSRCGSTAMGRDLMELP